MQLQMAYSLLLVLPAKAFADLIRAATARGRPADTPDESLPLAWQYPLEQVSRPRRLSLLLFLPIHATRWFSLSLPLFQSQNGAARKLQNGYTQYARRRRLC